MKPNLLGLAALLAGSLSFVAYAGNITPDGVWKTIDDRTGKARSVVRITNENGEYSGVVEKGLLPTDKDGDVCDQCTGDLENQRIIGMKILTGIRQNADGFDCGEVVDPDNGETYQCQIHLDPSGNQLEVRGYVGIPMLGRTQTWLRLQQAKP
jgi:uncharacterized protein (DUF2147 family)